MKRIVTHRPELAKDLTSEALPVEWERASLSTKLNRFKMALSAWKESGYKFSSKQTRKARSDACNACEYFEKSGNLYLGECHAPGCGCTKGKLFLESSKCTHPAGSRWPV